MQAKLNQSVGFIYRINNPWSKLTLSQVLLSKVQKLRALLSPSMENEGGRGLNHSESSKNIQ